MKNNRFLLSIFFVLLFVTAAVGADQRILYTEKMVGANHPTLSDTLNRLPLVEHNNDGTHNRLTQVKDPYVDVRAFGADPTGTNDSTAAFQNAVNYAYTVNNRTVLIPHGQYRINGTVTIGQGVMLAGIGSQGSNEAYGTSIIHYSTGNLFVWNGSGAAYTGTGGGLKNVLIIKASGYSGGDAIKLLATDDDHRPGEMIFENILIYGTGTGLWARGLHIDGTACITPGSKGIRSIVLHKFRVADVTTDNQYIYINQGVHISGTHVQVDVGDGTGIVGMTVAGDSDNIVFSNSILNAALVLSPSSTSNIVFEGRVSSLNVTTANAVGAFVGSLGTLTANSSSSTFRVLSGGGFQGPLSVSGNLTVNTDALSVDATNKRIGVGGVASPSFPFEAKGTVASYTKTGSTTQIGTIGGAYNTVCGNTQTFTFDTGSGKMFIIYTGGGAAVLVFADYKQTTVTLVANPSAEFEASSTPTAGKTGIFKSANSHTVSIKNNTGGSVTYGVLVLGTASSTTDPA